MKLLGTEKMFHIVLWINVVLLILHVVIETMYHDVNWLRIGERSTLASACIEVEGFFAIMSGLAVFELHYPSMLKMVWSKETKKAAILFVVQIAVWCFYK